MNFDAVIVLANEMDVNGILNSESKARAIKAVKVFKDNVSNCLVVSGWNYRRDTEIKIADALKKYITTELGVSEDLVITEPNSRDTVGDAYFTKVNLAIPLFWKNLCIVTSGYHTLRAKEIFQFVYGTNFNVAVHGAIDDAVLDYSRLNYELSSIKAFKDTFYGVRPGDDLGILNALRTRHPFYNGHLHEKI